MLWSLSNCKPFRPRSHNTTNESCEYASISWGVLVCVFWVGTMMNMVTWLIDCSWCPVGILVQCMYPPPPPTTTTFQLGNHMQCLPLSIYCHIVVAHAAPAQSAVFSGAGGIRGDQSEYLPLPPGSLHSQVSLRAHKEEDNAADDFYITFHYTIMYKTILQSFKPYSTK